MESGASPRALPQRFDVSRALAFFFEDPKWVPKLVIGSLFAFLSPFLIGTVFLTGYAMALARHTMEEKTPPLPEWDDFPSLFRDGLKGLGISLAHKLPLILFGLVVAFALLGSILLGRDRRVSPEEIAFIGVPALVGGFVIVFCLSLALIVYLPTAFVGFIGTSRFGAAFEIKENLDFIRQNGPTYILALITIVVAAFVAQFGLLLFCIGVFPAAFWSTCVFGYVIGELAKLRKEGEPG
ncbi:MAG TPA: DUF4013 domain-containing protein [Vicinamibacteria bacterium]|nr:DUF4013 domain-containing protein [Vicinamibacteria bacterium]